MTDFAGVFIGVTSRIQVQDIKYIVDRFDGGYAICEDDNNMMDILISTILFDVKEGFTIIINKNGEIYLTDDTELKERIADKFENIFKN